MYTYGCEYPLCDLQTYILQLVCDALSVTSQMLWPLAAINCDSKGPQNCPLNCPQNGHSGNPVQNHLSATPPTEGNRCRYYV